MALVEIGDMVADDVDGILRPRSGATVNWKLRDTSSSITHYSSAAGAGASTADVVTDDHGRYGAEGDGQEVWVEEGFYDRWVEGAFYDRIEVVSSVVKLCTVNRSSVQAIPDNTIKAILWNSERDDTSGWFTPVSGVSNRIQVSEPGVYLATVNFHWADAEVLDTATPYNVFSHHLQVNGTLPAADADNPWTADGSVVAGTEFNEKRWEGAKSLSSPPMRLVAGDKLSFWVIQRTGVSQNFGGRNRPPDASANCEFSVIRLGS